MPSSGHTIGESASLVQALGRSLSLIGRLPPNRCRATVIVVLSQPGIQPGRVSRNASPALLDALIREKAIQHP
jgi:hypothetical protein